MHALPHNTFSPSSHAAASLSPSQLAVGSCFPIGVATAMSVAGKTIGGVCALFLGRRFLKPLLSSRPRFGHDVGHGWLGPKLHRMLGSLGSLQHHLAHELRERPVQTMSLLRAAPLPTPFKLYGLCFMEEKLVPLSTYAAVALTFNALWSLVWSLTASSASSLKEAYAEPGAGSATSAAALATLLPRLLMLATLVGCALAFSRHARATLSRLGKLGSELSGALSPKRLRRPAWARAANRKAQSPFATLTVEPPAPSAHFAAVAVAAAAAPVEPAVKRATEPVAEPLAEPAAPPSAKKGGASAGRPLVSKSRPFKRLAKTLRHRSKQKGGDAAAAARAPLSQVAGGGEQGCVSGGPWCAGTACRI